MRKWKPRFTSLLKSTWDNQLSLILDKPDLEVFRLSDGNGSPQTRGPDICTVGLFCRTAESNRERT